jgi:hypothetical protein
MNFRFDFFIGFDSVTGICLSNIVSLFSMTRTVVVWFGFFVFTTKAAMGRYRIRPGVGM